MAEKLTPQEEKLLRHTVARANEQGWGITFGLLAGVGLFLATAILLIRGGENVGQHLALIGIYFPGYSVSWAGAFVGFVYAFVVGYALGRTVATVYNRMSPS
jgi:NhaP-type Na+/H+ or K+/H+ antiporter